jgi:hypothetical protein
VPHIPQTTNFTMSVSNTSGAPTLAGGKIDMAMIREKSDVRNRRTKIFCTIGPACWDIPQLEILIDAGMDIARLNFSHGDHKGHAMVLERVRTAAKNKQRNIGKPQAKEVSQSSHMMGRWILIQIHICFHEFF